MSKIVMPICEFIIGILLLFNPVGFTKGIVTVLGGLILIAGIVSIVAYFKAEPEKAIIEKKLALGIAEILAGLFCILKSSWFIDAFPVLSVFYGLIILITGIIKVQWTVDLIRMHIEKWSLAALGAAVTLICSVIILCNPFGGIAVLWTFIAVVLITEAVLDIVAAVFARIN